MSRIFVPSVTSWSTKHVLIRYHTALGSDAYPRDQFCKTCYTNTDSCRAVYYCRRCGYVADTLCAFEELTDTFDDDNADDDGDLIPGQEQWNTVDDQRESAAAQQIKHFSHDQHFLVLSYAVRDLDGTITCDGCMQPITMSTGAFYSCCAEEEQCRFYLHQTCAHLPRTRLHPLHRHQITLLSAAPSFDTKASLTIVTNATYTLTSNGFLFQTLLSMTLIGTRSSSTFIRTKKIARVVVFLVRTYKYLNLTLNLTYHPVPNELGDYYCEICEGERDPTHWFYYSTDCGFDIHPHCLLGRYPQVKLGSSYKHNAHPHPVPLVDKRKSAIPFDKRESILDCQLCGEPCEGLVFECAECNISIH
ncbi:hypothetical protein D8674_008940 [Pyrus ussuriensis x Pyrus communis]|uniref:DC1 domain-containing protein n=1 Tax=Pyrus ussuriensis x Pyrus communis TaxID=2448454 RepID=A0A5N5HZ12_9ROSA|nr:hypothetical protein D8674_008940 [Pyrus ussuriensis x Pyrus communis]